MEWIQDDGGRSAAGFRGFTGDCGARALAIGAEIPYRDAYDLLTQRERARAIRRGKDPRGQTARNGTSREVMRDVLAELGWSWTPTMGIGTGCTVHLRTGELPDGRLIVSLSRHYAAVIDGVIHDTHDPSRDGTRCVYGYWRT
jgi:hypothetical protein